MYSFNEVKGPVQQPVFFFVLAYVRKCRSILCFNFPLVMEKLRDRVSPALEKQWSADSSGVRRSIHILFICEIVCKHLEALAYQDREKENE